MCTFLPGCPAPGADSAPRRPRRHEPDHTRPVDRFSGSPAPTPCALAICPATASSDPPPSGQAPLTWAYRLSSPAPSRPHLQPSSRAPEANRDLFFSPVTRRKRPPREGRRCLSPARQWFPADLRSPGSRRARVGRSEKNLSTSFRASPTLSAMKGGEGEQLGRGK